MKRLSKLVWLLAALAVYFGINWAWESYLRRTNTGHGKKAIVIGATSGMGRQTAKVMAEDGYEVGHEKGFEQGYEAGREKGLEQAGLRDDADYETSYGKNLEHDAPVDNEDYDADDDELGNESC